MQNSGKQDFEPKDFLGYLISHSFKALSNRLIENFQRAGYEINRQQWLILAKCFHFPKTVVKQSDLVEMMMGDKTGVTRATEELVQRGLLVRHIDETDRRNRILKLTQEGTELVPILMETVHKTLKEITNNIEAQDLKVCKKVLATLIDNAHMLNKES